jgi:predicted tellurium resistance membrane protein TerC
MIALLMLTLMEVVLGIDNIIFISIVANKLPEKDQPRARNLGLLLALGLRIVLLFGLTLIMEMRKPISFMQYSAGEMIHEGTADMLHGDQRLGHGGDGITYLFHWAFTGESLILIIGGLFLLWKSVSEIHHKLEGEEEHAGGDGGASKPKVTVKQAVIQIALLNIVFSFDSILTALGLTKDLNSQGHNPIIVMILGILLSMLIMLSFAAPLGRFVNKHPSIQMLALSFLILIGFMLITEGAHLAQVQIFHTHVDTIPKGYLYFAMMFALLVEFLNIRTRSKSKPVQMRGVFSEAKDRHLYDLDK